MLKSRLELARVFREKGFSVGAEIGVFDGYFSEYLLKSIPGLRLYGVDPWEVYPGYRDHKFESSMQAAEVKARERTKGYDYHIIKKYSVDAAKGFENNSLDFVYIDGNHEYKYVKEDIELWAPKVRTGGIVAGDDWYLPKTGNDGVVRAVDEYVARNGYYLNVTPFDLSLEKEDDRQSQWWFEKG